MLKKGTETLASAHKALCKPPTAVSASGSGTLRFVGCWGGLFLNGGLSTAGCIAEPLTLSTEPTSMITALSPSTPASTSKRKIRRGLPRVRVHHKRGITIPQRCTWPLGPGRMRWVRLGSSLRTWSSGFWELTQPHGCTSHSSGAKNRAYLEVHG